MVNYKKTGKYIQIPEQNPTDVYVGKPEEVDYSGKSTRIDDNFTYIADHIKQGMEVGYVAGSGLLLTDNIFSVDTAANALVPSLIDAAITSALEYKQDTLIPGDNIIIDNNIISATGIIEYSDATSDSHGLMSADDKYKLDGIDDNANNFILQFATDSSIGGIIVGDGLSIDGNGVLSANIPTYSIVLPGGEPGLMSGSDKDKLDGISTSASRVIIDPAWNHDGRIKVDNTVHYVYIHPTYPSRHGIIPSGKLINGINVDEHGHVLSYSTTNESGLEVNVAGTGTIIEDASYSALGRTLTITKKYLGETILGSVNNIIDGTDIVAGDRLDVAIRKLQNTITSNVHTLNNELDKRLEFLGDVNSEPTPATEGDVYKASSKFFLRDGQTVEIGDVIIRHNSSWYVIPSGEKYDTWRPIKVNNVQRLSSSIGTGSINFKSSGITNLSWDSSDNTLYINTFGSGPGGSGNMHYTAGSGLTESTVQEQGGDYVTTFAVAAASDESIGGIIVGDNLSIEAGVLSVNAEAFTYTGSGALDVSDQNVISLSTDSTLQVTSGALGVKYHNDTLGMDSDGLYAIATDTWRSITINNNHIEGASPTVITGDTNTGTLSFSPGTNVILHATQSNGNTDIEIAAAGGGSGPGGDYSFVSPLVLNANTGSVSLNYANDGDVGSLAYDSTNGLYVPGTCFTASDGVVLSNYTFSVDFGGTGSANTVSRSDHTHSGYAAAEHTHSYASLTNKPTLATVATSGSYNDLSNKPTISTYINNSSTVEVRDSTGGAGKELAVKISATSGNALSEDADGLYVPDEPYTNGDATVINNKHIDVQYDDVTIGYNGSVLYVKKAPPATVVTIDAASSTTNLADNTIYKFTHNNITSITLTDTDHVSYCTLIIPKAGTSTTFNKPSGSRCIGYDCSNNNFSPVEGKEYQIAVDNVTGQLTFYVLRMDLDNFVPTT